MMSVAVVFLATYCLPTGAAAGTNIYVTTNGPGPSPFGTWATATSNIQWAVNVGINGDTVWISNGVYVLTNQITVTSNITISGLSTNNRPVVDGTNGSRCFEFTSAATGTLANLFITRGYADKGGGLYMYSGTVRDCIFSNNFASTVDWIYGGGGAYITGNTNLIQSCTFINNMASNNAGGLFVYDSDIILIQSCSFVNNTAMTDGDGGGLYLRSPLRTTIAGCTFYTNIAGDSGGGFAHYGSSDILITNCNFICNVSSNIDSSTGGGGGNFAGSGTNNLITHCTFDGNASLAGDGGGMFMSGSGWVCSDSFFSNNIATNSGGGIRLRYGAIVKNCVIARNTSQVLSGNVGGGGILMSDDGTLVQDCTIKENTALGNFAGGVYVSGGTLRNCLIRNNTVVGISAATGRGGGIRVSSASAKIQSCTIVSNYADWGGGGIYNPVVMQFDNCIIYFNKSGSVPTSSNLYDSSSSSYSNCCVAGFVDATAVITNNITTANPQFVDWTNSNYHLDRNSPCINAGVNRDWMANAVDFDGYRRVDKFSGRVDIGCYEYLPSGVIFSVR